MLTKDVMKKILQRLVDNTQLNWVDLPNSTTYVKTAIKNKLVRLMHGAIDTKAKQ